MEEKVQYQSEERLRDIQVIKILTVEFLHLIFFISGTNCFFRDENIQDGTPGRSTPTGNTKHLFSFLGGLDLLSGKFTLI